jgi:hypothetical protein
MSTVHAIIVSVIAAICLADPKVRVDLLESWAPLVGVGVSVFLGYCVLDTYLTLFYHDDELGGGVAIIIHHAMAIMLALYPLSAKSFAMITGMSNRFSIHLVVLTALPVLLVCNLFVSLQLATF